MKKSQIGTSATSHGLVLRTFSGGGGGVTVWAPVSPLSLRTNMHWPSCTTQEGVLTAPGLPLHQMPRGPQGGRIPALSLLYGTIGHGAHPLQNQGPLALPAAAADVSGLPGWDWSEATVEVGSISNPPKTRPKLMKCGWDIHHPHTTVKRTRCLAPLLDCLIRPEMLSPGCTCLFCHSVLGREETPTPKVKGYLLDLRVRWFF